MARTYEAVQNGLRKMFEKKSFLPRNKLSFLDFDTILRTCKSIPLKLLLTSKLSGAYIIAKAVVKVDKF